MSDNQNTGLTDGAAPEVEQTPTDQPAASEGSASDELDAARGGSAADDEPAIQRGSAADASTDVPSAAEGSASDEGLTAPTDTPSAAEGSASDEADAARGGSAADDEPAIQRGSAADDEPAIENGSAADDERATRSARKTREGVVTSASMDKTIVVTVTDRVRHPKYNKFVLRTKKLYAHDADNDAGPGDRVRVMETRPLSKNKRWRLVGVLERAR